MGGLISKHAKGVELLDDCLVDEVLENRRLELFKESIVGFAGQPQVLVDDAYEYFCKTAKFDGGCMGSEYA